VNKMLEPAPKRQRLADDAEGSVAYQPIEPANGA
jgi:hypothetical protein